MGVELKEKSKVHVYTNALNIFPLMHFFYDLHVIRLHSVT